jgi:hypothetical protein
MRPPPTGEEWSVMATRFSENLLSTRYVKGTLEEISSGYESLVRVAHAPEAEKDGNIQARRQLAEIKFHLARANSLFDKRVFQKALDEYKVTQGLVYGLVQPSFSPDVTLNPQITLPVEEAIFRPLLDVSLNIVTEISPNSIWSWVDVRRCLVHASRRGDEADR